MTDARRRFLPGLTGAAAIFLTVLITNIDVIFIANLTQWLLIAATAGLVGGCALAGFDTRSRLESGVEFTEWTSGIRGSLIGLVSGLAEVGAAGALGQTLAQEPLFTVVTATVSLAIISPAIVMAIQARRRETQRRNDLIDKAITLYSARAEAAEIAQLTQTALDFDIHDALAGTRATIAEHLNESVEELTRNRWAAIAQQLRATAQDTIRPISRDLWSHPVIGNSRISPAQILNNIVQLQPFRPIALILIFLATSMARVITVLGWWTGVASLTLSVLLIAGIFGAANNLMRRNPGHHAPIFIGATVLLESCGLLNFPLRDRWGTTPYTIGEFIAATLIGVAFILLTSGIGFIRSHRDDVARTFQSEIDQGLVASISQSRQIAQLARESARVLHGAVQTRLIACAVTIERASTANDANAFRNALIEAHSILAGPTPPVTTSNANTVLDEVQRKVSLWSGLCDIQMQIDPHASSIVGHLALDIGRVVEEGISNAIRHGSATSITVRVSDSSSGLEVFIEDNGSGRSGGRPGLGSSMLDTMSEQWSLTAPGNCTQLHVHLAK